MYWNNECKNVSKLLWKPSLDIDYKPEQEKFFNCSNQDISFDYFSDDVEINPKLKFKDIPLPDNSSKKTNLENKLFKMELKRFCTELDKKCYDDINPSKLLFDKHFQRIDNINDKVVNLDKFIRSKKFQLDLNFQQKKIVQMWYSDCTFVYNKLI